MVIPTKALGMIETVGLGISLEIADHMLKKASVRLVDQEQADEALVTMIIEGDISAVQAAMDVGTRLARNEQALVSFHIIAHPNSGMKKFLKGE